MIKGRSVCQKIIKNLKDGRREIGINRAKWSQRKNQSAQKKQIHLLYNSVLLLFKD